MGRLAVRNSLAVFSFIIEKLSRMRNVRETRLVDLQQLTPNRETLAWLLLISGRMKSTLYVIAVSLTDLLCSVLHTLTDIHKIRRRTRRPLAGTLERRK